MFQVEREKCILECLAQEQIASLAHIQALTGSSIATVRRDLNSMERRGLVLRSHGYVQLPEASLKPAQPSNLDEKERIAIAAAAQIQDGDTVFLSSGTTCSCLARHLGGKRGLRIVTINLDVARDLARLPGVSVSLLGGEVRVEPDYMETMDEYTIQILERLYFDKVFATVNGIDFQYGYSIRLQLQLTLFQHLLQNSREFYCLADSSKFNRRTHMHFCPIDAIRHVVTTEEVRQKYAAQFAQHDIHVIAGAAR